MKPAGNCRAKKELLRFHRNSKRMNLVKNPVSRKYLVFLGRKYAGVKFALESS